MTIKAFLVATISLVLLMLGCGVPVNTNFETISLDITPDKVTVNRNVIVAAKIRNSSGNKVTYTVPLMVNGVADDRKTIILNPGAMEAVEFTIFRDTPGQYKISVGALSATLVVEMIKPPLFTLSQLKFRNSEVNPGEDVIISASLKNNGGSKGAYVAKWQIDSTIEQTEEVILMPGTEYTFILRTSKTVPGTYTVKLDNLEGKFTILQPVVPIQIIDPALCPPEMKWDKTRKC